MWKKNKHLNNVFFLFMVSLTSGIALSATALAATTVSISPHTSPVSPGDTFNIEITVDPEVPIAGMQFNLIFNGSIVRVNSVTEGDLFKQTGANTFFNPGSINNAAGSVTNVYGCIMGKRNVSTPGTFAIIGVTASKSNAAPGTYPLELTNVKISDTRGNAVPIIVKNGTIIMQTTASSKTPAPSPTKAPSPIPSKKRIPGFKGVYAIAIFFGIAYLLMRRQKTGCII